jgi:hypothetical protein
VANAVLNELSLMPAGAELIEKRPRLGRLGRQDRAHGFASGMMDSVLVVAPSA